MNEKQKNCSHTENTGLDENFKESGGNLSEMRYLKCDGCDLIQSVDGRAVEVIVQIPQTVDEWLGKLDKE